MKIIISSINSSSFLWTFPLSSSPNWPYSGWLLCPFSGSLTAYYREGIPVQTRIHHHFGAFCAYALIIPHKTTIVTADERNRIFSGPAGASIPSDSSIFSINLLPLFQRIMAPKLLCLSYFPLFALSLEKNGGVTSVHDYSQNHPPKKSSASISYVSSVDATHQCSAISQAPSDMVTTVPTLFNLTQTPTG